MDLMDHILSTYVLNSMWIRQNSNLKIWVILAKRFYFATYREGEAKYHRRKQHSEKFPTIKKHLSFRTSGIPPISATIIARNVRFFCLANIFVEFSTVDVVVLFDVHASVQTVSSTYSPLSIHWIFLFSSFQVLNMIFIFLSVVCSFTFFSSILLYKHICIYSFRYFLFVIETPRHDNINAEKHKQIAYIFTKRQRRFLLLLLSLSLSLPLSFARSLDRSLTILPPLDLCTKASKQA